MVKAVLVGCTTVMTPAIVPRAYLEGTQTINQNVVKYSRLYSK